MEEFLDSLYTFSSGSCTEFFSRTVRVYIFINLAYEKNVSIILNIKAASFKTKNQKQTMEARLIHSVTRGKLTLRDTITLFEDSIDLTLFVYGRNLCDLYQIVSCMVRKPDKEGSGSFLALSLLLLILFGN